MEVLTLIKKDGTLVGKLANKPPTQQNIFNTGFNQNTNVTSLGLIYTQQFDSFNEFLKRISGEYKRQQKKKADEEKSKSAKPVPIKDAIISDKKTKRK